MLLVAADVEHDDLAVVAHLGEVGEGRRSGSSPALGRSSPRAAGGVGRGPVDADPDQLALRLGDLLGGLAEQGHRGAPRDQPAEVRRERAVEAEVQACPARGRRRRRSGCAGPRPTRRPRSGGAARRRRPGPAGSGRARRARRRWPAPCARSTPARRPGRRAARGRRSPRPGSARGWSASPARWSTRSPRTGWPSRRSRTRGSGRPRPRRAAGRRAGGPTRAGGGPGRGCAPRRAGRGGRWRRTAASRRRRRRPSRRSAPSVERVAEVGEGVAGRGQRGDPHPVADRDGLAVADRGALEGDVVVLVDEVRRAGAAGERQPAGDVVVVDVGLEDVGEPDAVLLEQVQHPVDVALRVDHEGDLAVVDEVAAVAQRRGVDGEDGQVGVIGNPLSTGRPERTQAAVPPATLTASKPAADSRSAHRAAAVAGGSRSGSTGRSRSSSRAGRAADPSGSVRAPGTWPSAYSPGSRTSTSTAPDAQAVLELRHVDLASSALPPVQARLEDTPGGMSRLGR